MIMTEDDSRLASVLEHPPEAPASRDVVTFAPTSNASVDPNHAMFSPPAASRNPELMGPILRRKKVVSMPLGAGGDFFFRDGTSNQVQPFQAAGGLNSDGRRVRQSSYTGYATNPVTLGEKVSPPASPLPRSRQNSRQRQNSGVVSGVLRRKQVSLDLLGPNDFFAPPPMETEDLLPTTPEDEVPQHDQLEQAKPALFRPLRFAPRMVPRNGGAHALPPVAEASQIDEETSEAFQDYTRANDTLKLQLSSFANQLKEEGLESKSVKQFLTSINQTQSEMESHEKILKSKFSVISTETNATSGIFGSEGASEECGAVDSGVHKIEKMEEQKDDGIIRATRSDKIKTAVLFCIMLGLTIIVCTWHTHLDEESFIRGPVGLACVTDCDGDLETRDFFHGHNQFETGEVIQLIMHIDANELAHSNHSTLTVEVYGTESESVKATRSFGPPGLEERHHQEESISVDFDNPQEPHILRILGSNQDIPMSFTLTAHVQSHLAEYSELVAALIMIMVYVLILLEAIHRTLVALFGSMIALLFFFIMNEGTTESIRTIMLHLEWSTLGLLFGMMLLVGELSHTGVFEWCAVRLLVASKGSFVRLLILLCGLTAVASAFLDNVTTMLLVAPVTIDMCNILDVDPRPYLIGEVLLSNIGGTATLIGDPPNIIIGSSFEEIGFVDFIVHVLPCIFLFCVPVALAMTCWIYRYYLTSTKMRVLDTAKLKDTYPIYDQPRLMIAGTSTFFVIMMFFLHPVHHKDTAWLALLGGFITIAFTNPHDVQEALRSHVEWDTLLFFAGLFVLVEVCAAMGLLRLIGNTLASYIEDQPAENQLSVAITLLIWVSAITSAFLDNIPYTATMIPIVEILAEELPDTLPLTILAWALSFGACLGGNGTLLGASSNIVTAGISTNKGFEISFLNFLYPGMLVMVVTVAIANLYMIVRYVWAA